QRPQEVGEVVGNGMKLKPHRVCGKCPARQPRPPDRALAFLDPLLARPALVIERNDPLAVRLMFVTMKPTRGYSSPGCHSTLAIPARGLVQAVCTARPVPARGPGALPRGFAPPSSSIPPLNPAASLAVPAPTSVTDAAHTQDTSVPLQEQPAVVPLQEQWFVA